MLPRGRTRTLFWRRVGSRKVGRRAGLQSGSGVWPCLKAILVPSSFCEHDSFKILFILSLIISYLYTVYLVIYPHSCFLSPWVLQTHLPSNFTPSFQKQNNSLSLLSVPSMHKAFPCPLGHALSGATALKEMNFPSSAVTSCQQ